MKRVIISATYDDDDGKAKTNLEAKNLAEEWLTRFIANPWCGPTEIFEFKIIDVDKEEPRGETR